MVVDIHLLHNIVEIRELSHDVGDCCYWPPSAEESALPAKLIS